MPWYMTVYDASGGEAPDPKGKLDGFHGGFLWANSERHAASVAKRRGLGEKIICQSGRTKTPYLRPSEWMRKRLDARKERNTIHALLWLAHMALKSGAATVEETVGDFGFVHEFIHTRSRSGPPYKKLIAQVESVERRVPGFLSK